MVARRVLATAHARTRAAAQRRARSLGLVPAGAAALVRQRRVYVRREDKFKNANSQKVAGSALQCARWPKHPRAMAARRLLAGSRHSAC